MPRGGKRPGAGAPHGNLNRLKHGKQSKIIQKAVELLLTDAQVRKAIKSIKTHQGMEFILFPAHYEEYQKRKEREKRESVRLPVSSPRIRPSASALSKRHAKEAAHQEAQKSRQSASKPVGL